MVRKFKVDFGFDLIIIVLFSRTGTFFPLHIRLDFPVYSQSSRLAICLGDWHFYGVV